MSVYPVPCGKCSLWGDPHYTTLANQQFDFQGKVVLTSSVTIRKY